MIFGVPSASLIWAILLLFVFDISIAVTMPGSIKVRSDRPYFQMLMWSRIYLPLVIVAVVQVSLPGMKGSIAFGIIFATQCVLALPIILWCAYKEQARRNSEKR